MIEALKQRLKGFAKRLPHNWFVKYKGQVETCDTKSFHVSKFFYLNTTYVLPC